MCAHLIKTLRAVQNLQMNFSLHKFIVLVGQSFDLHKKLVIHRDYFSEK